MPRPAIPCVERFLPKIAVNPESGCWDWTAATFVGTGYGVFALTRDKSTQAHRWSYTWFVGPIPAGAVIDHLCRNHICVNPNHLEVVSQRENIRRGEVGAALRSRTHCKNGHEFTEANTWINTRDGSRGCRTCNAVRQKATRERKLLSNAAS